MCCIRNKPNVLSQAHTHTHRCFSGLTGHALVPPCTKQWYCQESTTQPTTCCSVKPCVPPSAAARRSTSQTLYSRTCAALTIQGGWRKFITLLMFWVLSGLEECYGGGAVRTGDWGGQLLPGEVMCYFQSIVSTSCGSGVIGAGSCRLHGVKRRGGKSAA